MSSGHFQTPGELAQRAHAWFNAQGAAHGYVVLEFNDFGNAGRAWQVGRAVKALGDTFTIWMTRDFTAAQALQACVESEAQGFVAEGEIAAENGPGTPNPQAQNWPELIHALKDLPIAKAVATNFAPFTHHDGTPYPEKAKPLVDAGWRCLTECYDVPGDWGTLPERRAFYATHLGWFDTQPILGLYNGYTLADYPTRHNFRNWSIWDAGAI